MPPCGITETLSDVESVRVVHDYKNVFVSGTEKRFTACGHGIDEEGNLYFYDEMHRFEHLEDIHRYN